MSLKAKDAAIDSFKESVPVMLASETGGEGRNLQFANTIVNYDLPWNLMKIKQRIGRLHRIGQTQDVFIFNLAIAGSIEYSLCFVQCQLYCRGIGQTIGHGFLLAQWHYRSDGG